MAKTGQLAQINWAQFEELCKIQCTQHEICAVLDVTDKTLVKHIKLHYDLPFSEIYKKYTEYGKASLRRIQLKLAHSSAGMAIFLGKQYLGQRDEQYLHGENVGTKTIIYNINHPDKLLSRAEAGALSHQ